MLLLLLWPILISAQSGAVTFSRQGGFYEESFNLSLSCTVGHHIRYTTNGNTPTINSTLYVGPLYLNEDLYSKSNIYTIVNAIPSTFYAAENVKRSIIIRAAAFDENDSCVSPVVTQTYLIRSIGCDLHGLPVVSIAADSLALFDYETGIFVPGINYDPADSTHTGNYRQSGREWERQVNVEFYETDNSGINQQCGLRTHGGASRWFQQKGMRLYAREEYGKKRFKHRFFETTPIVSFKRLQLHPFRCSNWLQTGAQDYLAHRVAGSLDIDVLGVRQVVVFINGEYWGIYTLEESPDQRYLEDHYHVDLESVNLVKWWVVEQYGDITEWMDFYNWMRYEADLNNPVDSTRAFTQLDINSFVDYLLFGTFSANLDWPQNNIMLWQSANGEPFRFLLFDGDGCFTKVGFQALDNAIHQGGNSVIFNRLLTSSYFRRLMRERYLTLKQTCFSYEAMRPYLEKYRNAVDGEIASQAERFGFPWNYWKWQSDMDTTDAFLRNRYAVFEKELFDFLFIEDTENMSFTLYPNPSSGSFYLSIHSDVASMLPVEIFDRMGRRVAMENKSLHFGENILYLQTDLPPGLYLIKVGSSVKQIIIQ